MVDIMDMEDIFRDMLERYYSVPTVRAEHIAHRLILEVADFVDCQKNIACNNCKGKKFKKLKEAWQVL